jgi:hypothetical protein
MKMPLLLTLAQKEHAIQARLKEVASCQAKEEKISILASCQSYTRACAEEHRLYAAIPFSQSHDITIIAQYTNIAREFWEIRNSLSQNK